MFHSTERGAPQGGTLSPLLLNISLTGLEDLLSNISKGAIHQSAPTSTAIAKNKRTSAYGHCVYADDFLITAKSKNDIETIVPILQQWLGERGLALNPDKTQVVPIQKGCNFLGFTIRQLGGKCLCTPQKQRFWPL